MAGGERSGCLSSNQECPLSERIAGIFLHLHDTNSPLGANPSVLRRKLRSYFRNNYLRTIHSLRTIRVRPTIRIKTMSQTSTCAVWEENHLNSQDKEPKLRLSLKTRVTEDVAVIRCKGRIAYGIEAAALSGEIAELAHQTRDRPQRRGNHRRCWPWRTCFGCGGSASPRVLHHAGCSR